MSKIDEFMKNIRANLTTKEMNGLMNEMREEIKVSEKYHIKEIKSNILEQEGDDLSDLFPDLKL